MWRAHIWMRVLRVFRLALRYGDPKLVDELCVSGGEGDGVVAGGEVGGDVPDVGGTVWHTDDGVDEVRPGRGLCGKNGLASAVEFDGCDGIAVQATEDGTAV